MAGCSTRCVNEKLPAQYTGADLLLISQSITQRFSPNRPRAKCFTTNNSAISSQQLREVSQQISTYYAAKLDWNIPRLLLLPVTPNSLYIYWNLGHYQMDFIRPKQQAEKQWLLRVVAQSTTEVKKIMDKPVFEMPIEQAQSRQKITLETAYKPAIYSASLGMLDINHIFSPVLQTQPCQGYYTQTMPLKSVNPLLPADRIHYAATNLSAKGISR